MSRRISTLLNGFCRVGCSDAIGAGEISSGRVNPATIQPLMNKIAKVPQAGAKARVAQLV